jgi:hypothetical protein
MSSSAQRTFPSESLAITTYRNVSAIALTLRVLGEVGAGGALVGVMVCLGVFAPIERVMGNKPAPAI